MFDLFASNHRILPLACDELIQAQREDGGWDWLKCGWPPMESDDHYGVTLAAIAVGTAPGKYAQSEAAQRGLEGIRRYLSKNTPPTLHHSAMLLWAASYTEGLLTREQKTEIVKQLQALQREDGGWALASLGDWERADGKEQDTKTSDGYGTAFVIYALRRADVPAESEGIQRGVEWLKTHQRESGRWFTRSLNRDSKHFISHAGTAMAVLALAACDQLPQ